jgi:hypothetical protein
MSEVVVMPMTGVSGHHWAWAVAASNRKQTAPQGARRASAQMQSASVSPRATTPDIHPDVLAAWPQISVATRIADLPDALAQRFRLDLHDRHHLRARWEGNTDGLTDTSRSGLAMALITCLRRAGYSAVEAAQLAFLHAHGDLADVTKFSDDRSAVRAFTRAWNKADDGTPAADTLTGGIQPTAHGAPSQLTWTFSPARRDVLTSPPGPRPWVYGTLLMRGHTTILASPGGVGKTSLLMVMSLAMTSGRALLARENAHVGRGHRPHRPFRVAVVNLEDPLDELERRVAATARHYRLDTQHFAERLFLNSGRVNPLVVALRTSRNTLDAAPVVDALITALREEQIEVLIVDPLLHSHEGDENDNTHMGFVMHLWNRIASEANCAVVLVHHFRKGGSAGDAEAVRGASALQGAARVMLTVRTMTKDEAEDLGLGETERLSCFRFDSAKANMAPANETEWFRLVGVPLMNGTEEYPSGDSVQTVERWEPSGEFRDLVPDVIEAILRDIETADPPYTNAAQSPRWLGNRMVELSGISREAAARTTKLWLAAGFIKTGLFKNKNGSARTGITLAIPIEAIMARVRRP